MTDALISQLTRELTTEAAGATPRSDLAALVIARASRVRRRRAVVAAFVPAVAIAAVLVAVTVPGRSAANRPSHQPNPSVTAPSTVVTPSLTPTTQPASVQLARLAPGTVGTTGLRAGSFADITHNTIHLAGGSDYRLPADWSILSLTAAGPGLVIHVELTSGKGKSLRVRSEQVSYLSPDGSVRVLAGGHVPFLVNPTASVVLASAGDDPLDGGDEVLLFSLPSGQLLQRTSLPPGFDFQHFLTDDTVVVHGADGSPDGLTRDWNPSTGAVTAPVDSAPVSLTSVLGDRLDWWTKTRFGVVYDDGTLRWQKSLSGDVVGFSPSGGSVGWTSPAERLSRLTIFDAATGVVTQTFDLTPLGIDARGAGQVSWQDDRHLIVEWSGYEGADAHYAQCTIGTSSCADLGVDHDQILFPGQRYFE